jgi:hypothetical protein
MEVTLKELAANVKAYKTIDTLVVDANYDYRCYTLDSDAHREVYIYLANLYKVRCIKFVPVVFNNEILGTMIRLFGRITQLSYKKATTVKSIIIDADSKTFICSYLIRFIDRANVKSITCRLSTMIILDNGPDLLNRIKSALVKRSNYNLREIKFQRPNDPLSKEGVTYSEYTGHELTKSDTEADRVLERNMFTFRFKRSIVIALLAIKKFKKSCEGIGVIHKDIIVALAHLVWNTSNQIIYEKTITSDNDR